MAEPDEALGNLPTEARNPRSSNLDQLSTLDLLTLINDEDASVAAAVRACLPKIAEAVDRIAARFEDGGRLFYLGAGTSGRLGVLDASECPPTFSVDATLFTGLIAGGDSALRRSSEGSEDLPDAGAADLLPFALTQHDSVVGIAASGRTPYVLGALAYARERSAFTVALTCAGGSASPSHMALIADLAIEVATGPEVLTGSTRMKAGTATKLILNSLSTAIMVRRGAVFANLMVNVQTTNRKLINRAERILAEIARCTPGEAKRLLQAAGSLKTAIAMQHSDLDRESAEKLLSLHGGRLRDALNATD